MKKILVIIWLLALVGLMDSAYLTYEHFSGRIPPCSNSLIFVDCGRVLQSIYSEVFGIPLAFFGIIYYSAILVSTALVILKKDLFKLALVALTFIGALFSLYFMYLQIIVIGSLCQYCTLSAAISFILFFVTQLYFSSERKKLTILVTKILYKQIVKPIYFQFDPERIHTAKVQLGEVLGKLLIFSTFSKFLFVKRQQSLQQKIKGIHFDFPIGLAAGFDYEAKLTQILPSLGFGFGTVGTITNQSYEGNPRPMLGRLPKSKSLMVNKGFKNLGAKSTAEKLNNFNFDYPVGISIGRTNGVISMTQKQSVEDVVNSFKVFELSMVKHSYYELNISCPNLFGNVSFYPPHNLEELLTAVEKLKIKRPIFIKMPIEKSDKEVLKMLAVIAKHNISGVIFGNLQKNRSHPSLLLEEVAKYDRGYFSGKPTFTRSNELITLAYRKYGKRLVIIGCGGIFSAEDAYEKIKRGASLVQLITGMIFEGPQLIADINMRLPTLMKNDGYTHISQAVGSKK